MFHEEEVIVLELKRICQAVPEFVIDFMGGQMLAADELAFARKLVDLAEQLMHHAKAKDRVVLDAEVIVVEPGSQLALPSGESNPSPRA